MRKVALTAGFIIWTYLCIYSTYWNTVEHASPKKVGDVYEITYYNTGETHVYR